MRKRIETPITPEEFEDILECARSDVRKGENRFEVLDMLMMEHEIFKLKQYNRLEKSIKRGSEYKIMQDFDKIELAIICKDKLKYEEEPDKFNNLFKKYCVNNYKSEITDDDVEYARHIPVNILLEGMTDIKIRNKMSSCPFCDGNSKQKFSCKDNLFQCFKCGAKGDSIGFYMKLVGTNFIEAIKELKKW